LKIASRQEFEALRDCRPEELESERDKLIRQFICGDAVGPITDRKMTSDYEDDLLMISLKDEQ
jgi:hypothetical protein